MSCYVRLDLRVKRITQEREGERKSDRLKGCAVFPCHLNNAIDAFRIEVGEIHGNEVRNTVEYILIA